MSGQVDPIRLCRRFEVGFDSGLNFGELYQYKDRLTFDCLILDLPRVLCSILFQPLQFQSL